MDLASMGLAGDVEKPRTMTVAGAMDQGSRGNVNDITDSTNSQGNSSSTQQEQENRMEINTEEAVCISEVIGEGADAHRMVRVGDWTLTLPGENGMEAEIPDTDLAQKLGMTPHHLRELSARHESAGNIQPRVNRTVRESKNGGRPGIQRFYSEADALFLVTRSDRPEAIALTKEMIRVYMLVRRGLLAPVRADHGDMLSIVQDMSGVMLGLISDANARIAEQERRLAEHEKNAEDYRKGGIALGKTLLHMDKDITSIKSELRDVRAAKNKPPVFTARQRGHEKEWHPKILDYINREEKLHSIELDDGLFYQVIFQDQIIAEALHITDPDDRHDHATLASVDRCMNTAEWKRQERLIGRNNKNGEWKVFYVAPMWWTMGD